MFDLTGKAALITGASGGIGSAVAKSLHAQGATVAISGTRREALDALAAELGGRVHVLTANLSDKAVNAAPPSTGTTIWGNTTTGVGTPWSVVWRIGDR